MLYEDGGSFYTCVDYKAKGCDCSEDVQVLQFRLYRPIIYDVGLDSFCILV